MSVTAKVVAHSQHISTGQEILTFELEYPRIVHSEVMTHRQLSRNAASSRAIPVKAMIEQVRNNIAMPVRFGKNKSGMQDTGGDHDANVLGYEPREWWKLAASSAIRFATEFADAQYHKQIANRLIEPFQHIKVVVTATCYDNFYYLRFDGDADPTIYALAVEAIKAHKASDPVILRVGDWHVPYYFDGYWKNIGNGLDEHGHTLDEALRISASCCAQVSYRKNDSSLEKADDVYDRLIGSGKIHASPFEHQASPMLYPAIEFFNTNTLDRVFGQKGVTHLDKRGDVWSGNFKHWIQHRQLIPNHVCNDYQL